MGFKKFLKDKAKDYAEQWKIKNLMNNYRSKEELQKLAKKLHLKTGGNKGDLIKRILGSPDFDLNVLQRTFTKTELKQICAELKLETTGTDTELWNRILVKKGIIERIQEISESQDETPQVSAAKKEEPQKSTVIRTTTSGRLKPTTAQEFMRKYLNRYDLNRLVRQFNLDFRETRAHLIDQIVSNPNFGLNDLKQAIGKDRLGVICRVLDLRVSGSKDELWERVVEALNLEIGGENTPPQYQITKASIQTFMQQYLTKECLKEIVSEFPIKQTGTKDELIDRLITDPVFELNDIFFVLRLGDMKEISQKLRLPISGNKEAIWERILQKLLAEQRETEPPPPGAHQEALTEPLPPAKILIPGKTPKVVIDAINETFDDSKTCEKTGEGVIIRRGFVPRADHIMMGVRIENRNETKYILDIRSILEYSDSVLELTKSEGDVIEGRMVIFSKIGPGEAATAIYHLTPRVCTSTKVSAHVIFLDGANNQKTSIDVPALIINACKFVQPRPATEEEFQDQRKNDDTQFSSFVVHNVPDTRNLAEAVKKHIFLYPIEITGNFARFSGESLTGEFFGLELVQTENKDVEFIAFSLNPALNLGISK